ncbi:DNA topoisomerase IB [Actinomycetospora straminea]|uniref:DNA topoisomerase IB n=1 Tax=Actinomycetospora straminea TaxID=663607 RepID=UPI00236570CB|nr:DNA topoisomerase IB [Actinomycetospora straminea]MDD7936117.1 DNA topoisomerase IB [Actinomycetospora straminea]
MDLVHVEPYGPGLGRRRRGKGWSYFDRESGASVTDAAHLDRIRKIVIPPAWEDVWICADPLGHIQAVGTDAAGRRQYRYHEQWTLQRNQEKFIRVARLGHVIGDARTEIAARLTAGRGLGRDRVLAGAVWMLDLGVFRVGHEEYASDDSPGDASFGLATLRREHAIARRDGGVEFRYTAKSGVPRRITLHDEHVHALVTSLKRRRGGGEDLLAFRRGGRGGDRGPWHDVTAQDVNDAVRELIGEEFTAKDLRTWNAGVQAAVALAGECDDAGAPPRAQRKQKSAVTRTMKAVAEQLGNTPAVCKRSYVDPVIVTHFEQGRTIAEALRSAPGDDRAMRLHVERAVLELLDHRGVVDLAAAA